MTSCAHTYYNIPGNVYNGKRCEGENDLSRSKANSNLTVKMNGFVVDGVEYGVARRQNKKKTIFFIPKQFLCFFSESLLLLLSRELFDTRLREKLIIFNFFRIIPKGTSFQKHSHHQGEIYI